MDEIIINVEDMTDTELLIIVDDGLATDSVRLSAACELLKRLYILKGL